MKTKQTEYLKKGKLAIVDQGQQLVGGYSDVENRKDVGNIYEATYVASEITIACQIVFVKYLRAEFRITKN